VEAEVRYRDFKNFKEVNKQKKSLNTNDLEVWQPVCGT